MHWFDRYIKIYRDDCIESGFGATCNHNYCQWCADFLEFIEDVVGLHDDVSPYDYPDIRQYRDACAAAKENHVCSRNVQKEIHWFDTYIDEYRASCIKSGCQRADCDNACQWCDEFVDYMNDDIGAHDEIWPGGFTTKEQYIEAIEFARECDEIIDTESVRRMHGDVQGISSRSVYPLDYPTREAYNNAVYRQLFSEAISRYPVIPHTDFWFNTYVKFLKDSESVFCADKSILALLDELDYSEDGSYVHIIVPPEDELEREIRYSSWKKPRHEMKHSSWYSSWYYHSNYSYYKKYTRKRRKNYTETQFRNDLFYHYPELFTLVSGVMHKRSFFHYDQISQMDNNLEEYLPDVLIDAFYLNDLFGLSVEESIQNGLEGLAKGLKNGLWQQAAPLWMLKYSEDEQRERYVLWEMRLNMLQNSLQLADRLGFRITRKAAIAIEPVMFKRDIPWDISPDAFLRNYRDWEAAKFASDQMRKFFADRLTSDFVALQVTTEEQFDCDCEVSYSCAIDLLRELVKQLPDRERNCLVLRYGLESGNPMSLEEIGNELWISKERVRQIEKKAIVLLKKLPRFADLCELTGNPVPNSAKHK